MIPLDAVRDSICVVLAMLGALFFLVGTVGLLRLPDFFCRTHAATKCDTVGAGSLLLALAIITGTPSAVAKIVLLALLVLVTSPTTGHSLARAAHRTGLTIWTAEERRSP